MNLSDKLCYPTMDDVAGEFWEGITFRERLIIALASNPAIYTADYGEPITTEAFVVKQADAIIKEVENG